MYICMYVYSIRILCRVFSFVSISISFSPVRAWIYNRSRSVIRLFQIVFHNEGGVLMEENGEFRSFFFFSGEDWKGGGGLWYRAWRMKRRMKIARIRKSNLDRLSFDYLVSFSNDRSNVRLIVSSESLNNTLPRIQHSKSDLSHRYFIASISRHIHQPVSTPLNSLSIPLDLPPPSSASTTTTITAAVSSGWKGNTWGFSLTILWSDRREEKWNAIFERIDDLSFLQIFSNGRIIVVVVKFLSTLNPFKYGKDI